MPALSTTERRHRFEHLIDQAEALQRADPARYRRRLTGLGLLGNAVVLGSLFLVLALVVGALALMLASPALALLLVKTKLALGLIPLGWFLFRALSVRVPTPDGRALRRTEHPALFAELDGLRRALAAPPLHRVLLTPDLNAAVLQVPRLGIFGLYRNTLMLGLPLLLALPPAAARAVLAHEFGHLSSNTARFNARVYRQRARWETLRGALAQHGGLAVAGARRFLDWYAPYYTAYSFPTARANEYEADAASVRLTSGAATAAALVATPLSAALAEERFWSPLLARADREPQPPSTTFTALQGFFRETRLDESDFGDRLGVLLREETDRTDTHPCLRARLEAIGEAPVRPGALTRSAAEVWLGDRLAPILADFDRHWAAEVAAAWQSRYQDRQQAHAALAALETRPPADLTTMDHWNLAMYTETLRPAADPLPLYRDYQARVPGDPDADFVIGRLLLERGEPAGLDCLERATRARALIIPACKEAIAYLSRGGDAAGAERWRERAEAHLDREMAARAERSGLSRTDRLLPADLTPESRATLRGKLLELGGVRRAWIARKQVRVFPETPCYLMVIEPRWFTNSAKTLQRLAADPRGPGDTLFVTRGALIWRLRRQLQERGERLL